MYRHGSSILPADRDDQRSGIQLLRGVSMGLLMAPKDVANYLGISVDSARDVMRQMNCLQMGDGPRPRYAVTQDEVDRWVSATVAPNTGKGRMRRGRPPKPIVLRGDLFEKDGRIKRR